MNTLTLQKQAQKRISDMDKFIRKASRALLEFEVAQSKWERAHGHFKIYESADAYMKHVRRQLKSR